MDRRAVFFFCAAVVALILVPIIEAGHRWVPISLAIVYVLLSVASLLDARGRAHLDDR